MNRATESTMAGVAKANARQQEREQAKAKKKVLGTAKPEWVIPLLDLKKRTLDLPETIEREGKTYKIRKETITGLIALSEHFFPGHKARLNQLLDEYDAKVGRPRPIHGETREYQVSNKGMLAVPFKFLLNDSAEGTGKALVTFYKDRIEIRNQLPAKK